MLAKFIYITQPGEEPRDLMELELDILPEFNENITHADRAYKVLDRAYVVRIVDDNRKIMTASILVGQIAGPPHLDLGTPALVGIVGAR